MHPYFVGLDVHKQVIAYCVKKADGQIVQEDKIKAKRAALAEMVQKLPQPWVGAMEATMFSHWIYAWLKPHAAGLHMGHPAKMKAIQAGKNKSDKMDARTIADLLRCDALPKCFVISPELGRLRQQLRFRQLVVKQQVAFMNRTAGLLMESGVEYERRRLHGKRYFSELMQNNGWVSEELKPLFRFGRQQIESLAQMDRRLIGMLEQHPQLKARVAALRKIDGVGPILALSWALETGTPERFPSIKDAQSYCGLTSAFWESAGKQKRQPLSKQRNKHLQTVLIEVAQLAPMHNEKLKAVYQNHKNAGADHNVATLEVARKLVAYLLAVDRAWLAAREPAAA
jgi:transposase